MLTAAAPTLDDLLLRFLSLTETAKRACTSEDAAALAGALDARELVGNSLIAFGRSARSRSPLPAATRRLMAEVVKTNGELEAQVESARDSIRRQLERITHDETAVAGYAGTAPRTSRVDVRR